MVSIIQIVFGSLKDATINLNGPITFRSEVFCSINNGKLDEVFTAGYNQLLLKNALFNGNFYYLAYFLIFLSYSKKFKI